MWLKLCFLLLYFLVLFVLARVFEAVVWYETGFFATQLVDPVALSFRKLRTILECRGLGHSGLPEKKDVRELVEKSGRAASLLPSLPPLGPKAAAPAKGIAVLRPEPRAAHGRRHSRRSPLRQRARHGPGVTPERPELGGVVGAAVEGRAGRRRGGGVPEKASARLPRNGFPSGKGLFLSERRGRCGARRWAPFARLKANVIRREKRGGMNPNVRRLVGCYLQFGPAYSPRPFPYGSLVC